MREDLSLRRNYPELALYQTQSLLPQSLSHLQTALGALLLLKDVIYPLHFVAPVSAAPRPHLQERLRSFAHVRILQLQLPYLTMRLHRDVPFVSELQFK